MQVSVAMATYLGSSFIVEQLRSIAEQSLPPAEIVVCDDRSTDATARLVLEFARDSAVPVRLFVNDERLGWRENFMRAASLCSSEVIAFCDQDDVWDRRKLERVVGEIERTQALMVFHDATIVGPDLTPTGRFLQGGGEPDRAAALRRSPWRDVYGFTIAFRSELLALWSYWPSSVDKSAGSQRAAHDQWLLFLGSALGTTLHVPEPLASYRQHERNAVGVKDAFRRTSRIDDFLRYRDVVNLRLVVLDTRIRILGEIAARRDRFANAAGAAAEAYDAHRRRIAFQVAIRNSDRAVTRLLSFAALLSGRSYSDDVWGLGRLHVVDDCVATLLGPIGLAWLTRLQSRRSTARSRPSSRRGRDR